MGQRYSIQKNGRQFLLDFLGLGKKGNLFDHAMGSYDGVLVSIDFEHLENLQQDESLNLDTQVGLALLDTRHLATSKSDEIISTFNFASGSQQYCKKVSKKFLFGKSISIHQRDLLNSIQSLIPTSRHIILVGHAVINELQVLKKLKLDFLEVIAILDTQRIAHQVLPECSPCGHGLGDLLDEFGCPYDKLHCAGNDAHFTLRLLLLLAAKSLPASNDAQHLHRLKEIALTPLPHQTNAGAKAAKKEARRLRRAARRQFARVERFVRMLERIDPTHQRESMHRAALEAWEALGVRYQFSHHQHSPVLTKLSFTRCLGERTHDKSLKTSPR